MPPDQSRRSHGILCAADDMTPAGLVTSEVHKPAAQPNEEPINMNTYLDHFVMFLSVSIL